MEEGELPQPDIDARTEKFASWQWKYGRKIPFEYEMEKRFPWGNIQIQFHVDEGMIQDVNVFSDAMDQEMIGMLLNSFLIWIVVGPIYRGSTALQQHIGYNLIYTIAKVFATAVVMVYNFITRKIFLEKK